MSIQPRTVLFQRTMREFHFLGSEYVLLKEIDTAKEPIRAAKYIQKQLEDLTLLYHETYGQADQQAYERFFERMFRSLDIQAIITYFAGFGIQYQESEESLAYWASLRAVSAEQAAQILVPANRPSFTSEDFYDDKPCSELYEQLLKDLRKEKAPLEEEEDCDEDDDDDDDDDDSDDDD